MDKRFIKIKKVSEERYFRNEKELYKFIDKMNGFPIQTVWASNILCTKEYLVMHYPDNKKQEIFIAGRFLFRIFRGFYERIIDGINTEYTINILAEQKADLLTMNDRRQLFKDYL